MCAGDGVSSVIRHVRCYVLGLKLDDLHVRMVTIKIQLCTYLYSVHEVDFKFVVFFCFSNSNY